MMSGMPLPLSRMLQVVLAELAVAEEVGQEHVPDDGDVAAVAVPVAASEWPPQALGLVGSPGSLYMDQSRVVPAVAAVLLPVGVPAGRKLVR